MFTGTSFSSTARAAVMAAVAAVALTSFAPSVVMAAPAEKGVSSHGTSGATDFSSARRRHYSRGGNAAALAAFAGVVGTIGAIAASQSRRDYYYDNGPGYGYYGGGPAYYDGGPVYYGGGAYRGYGGSHGYDNSRRMTW